MSKHTGILDFDKRDKGRLRQLDETIEISSDDPIVPNNLVEAYDLRPGLLLEVELGAKAGGNNGGGKNKPRSRGRNRRGGNRNKRTRVSETARLVEKITGIETEPPAVYDPETNFEDLTSLTPEPRLTLEYPGCPASCRLIDLFCPIGYGTRGMIVSPPKAGKTMLLQQIATAIERNHPEVEVYALLIDERPEEVTDFRRNVPCKVWASSNDHTLEQHVGLAKVAIERAKRKVEMGKDVVILLDSLTRLGRAFNNVPGQGGTGRTLSGGLDSGALAIPKQIFGAARKAEEGGSLTIVATCLIDTGSRGDQVIFEEFKGTGNMEVILDRKIADKRLYPAIDLAASGTRKEDRLMPTAELDTVTALRRKLMNMSPPMQIEQLLKALDRFETNEALVGLDQQNRATARA